MIASKLFILGLTGASNASTLSKRQVSDATANSPDVCFPSNSTGFPDLNAPCNALSRIQQLCVFGEQIRSILDSPDLNDYSQIDSGDMKQHSPGYQRDCICSSQQFDQMRGCMACYDAHGGDAQAVVEPKAIESFSSSYCAAEATPTVGYPTAILAIVGGVGGIEETGSASDVSSASLFDSIGTQTDVSLYYTPSATGSQAWDIALPTGSSATFSNLSTSGGQIVPTAAVERVKSTGDAETSTTTAVEQAKSTGDAKTSTTGTVSEGGAMATGTIDRNMAFGAIGVAAIVAGL